MARVSVTLQGIDELKKLQAFLSPDTFSKAQKGGIIYAAKAVPPAVAKGITSAYNFTSARVKKDITGVRLSPDGDTATIGFSRRPPTLTQVKPNPGKRGKQPGLGRGKGWGPSKGGRPLTATVIKADGRQTFTGAFIATGNSGNQVVLRRDSQGNLYSVYAPSIGAIYLGSSRVGQALRADVAARIQEQFTKGFERALGQAARGFGRR
jgi:hypothetical protein